ncbi:hypothetical protein M8C21_021142 [Ambrosia artemisiifolia]|uniref:Beta-lactamase-related domain-containing protein n=1 Tax=Ambrosia artemisiifolia TaxID=4212 RepID=A0AAD5D1B3_AMBAR|nr:hypothetical protein M8C21_021142 [Ambrosia artemisiifolia]
MTLLANVDSTTVSVVVVVRKQGRAENAGVEDNSSKEARAKLHVNLADAKENGRPVDVKEDDLEFRYEKLMRKKSLAIDNVQHEVDPVDALPVKTLDGQVYYKTVSTGSSQSKNAHIDDETVGENEDVGRDNGVVKLTKAEKRAKQKKMRKEAKKVTEVEEGEKSSQAEVLLHRIVDGYMIVQYVNSDIEAKLRSFLLELKNTGRILGIQICAYKDGKVIIDTAAGVLGKDDPRPVQPDNLFPVFSVTKGVTTGMVHWLADKGKLKLDENVANIWPDFGTNGKDQTKVNHVLNHTAGLHNALAGISEHDHALFCDFDECLKRIAMVAPETEPGQVQLYHYLSYGWLCGGIIEHASGKKFQDVLEEAIVRPLDVEGELYIGIPPGVEPRLATVSIDAEDLILLDPEHDIYKSSRYSSPWPSTFTFSMVSSLIPLMNNLNARRAIQPAANGHFSARAVARYYATLVDGGVVPPRHPSQPLSPIQSRPVTDEVDCNIFSNPKEKIHEAFLGSGDYKDLAVTNGIFGMGFIRFKTIDGSPIGVGLPGLGGSTGYCDINNRFAIAVTVNKLSIGALTGEIIRMMRFKFKSCGCVFVLTVHFLLMIPAAKVTDPSKFCRVYESRIRIGQSRSKEGELQPATRDDGSRKKKTIRRRETDQAGNTETLIEDKKPDREKNPRSQPHEEKIFSLPNLSLHHISHSDYKPPPPKTTANPTPPPTSTINSPPPTSVHLNQPHHEVSSVGFSLVQSDAFVIENFVRYEPCGLKILSFFSMGVVLNQSDFSRNLTDVKVLFELGIAFLVFLPTLSFTESQHQTTNLMELLEL